jgi:hypothetical protein
MGTYGYAAPEYVMTGMISVFQTCLICNWMGNLA